MAMGRRRKLPPANIWEDFMRLHTLFATAALAAAFALPVSAADTAQQSAMKSCSASWSAMSAADKARLI